VTTNEQTYTEVQPGDGLWVIAARLGVTQALLVAFNPWVRGMTLHPGDRLVIPQVDTAPAPPPVPQPEPAPEPIAAQRLTGIHGGFTEQGSSIRRMQKFHDDGLRFDIHTLFFSGGTVNASKSAAWGQFKSTGSYLVDPELSHLKPEWVSVTVPLNWENGTVTSNDARSVDGLAEIAANLDRVANGMWDEDQTVMINYVKNLYPGDRVIVRIGHEFSNDWGTWAARSTETYAAYKRAFRHVAELWRAELPGCLIDWCDLRGWWMQHGKLAYPGDDIVDIIGIDIYWRGASEITDTEWTNTHRNVLEDHHAFATSRGKPVSYPEWGRSYRDTPEYLARMKQWFDSLPLEGPGSLAYQSYFSQGGYLEGLSPYDLLLLPNVYARYRELFSP